MTAQLLCIATKPGKRRGRRVFINLGSALVYFVVLQSKTSYLKPRELLAAIYYPHQVPNKAYTRLDG